MDFTWNEVVLNDGAPGKALKIQSSHLEVNVWFTLPELQLLENVPSANRDGGSLKIGTAANSKVWWSCDGDTVSLFIGNDDQSWDVSAEVPLWEFLNAVTEQNDT